MSMRLRRASLLNSGGETLIEEYEVSAGNILVDLTNTGMVLDSTDTIDLSEYAGNDTDTTTHRMELIDSADKVASFFVGAAGGGEAVGTDIFSSFDFTVGWNVFGANIIDSDTFETTAAFRHINKAVFTLSKIYKNDYTASTSAGGTCMANLSTKILDSGDPSTYFTAISTSVRLFNDSIATTDVSILSSLPLTDVPTTGVHCITEQNGSTRGMTSVDAGFNPNAITAIKVYEL